MLRIMKRLFKIIGHIVKKKTIEKWFYVQSCDHMSNKNKAHLRLEL